MSGKDFAGRGFLLLGKDHEVLSVGPGLVSRFRAGMKCYSLLFGRKEACVGCPLKRVFEMGERSTLEWRPFPDLPAFDVFFTPILDESGKVSMVAEEVALSGRAALKKLQVRTENGLIDVNEELLKDRAQQQFRHKVQQQRAEEERNFIRLAAHQMQHPIALLRGYLELFLQDPSPTNHTILEEELLSLAQLVSGMLMFAHGSEHLSIEHERLDAVALNRQVFDSFVKQYPDRNWEFISTKKTLQTSANRETVQHLLEIFLGNAVQYSFPGAKIKMEVGEKNGGVYTSVYDEGRGISSENIHRIFEPFFRESRDTPGTGLGLSMAKKVLEKYGGSLKIESEKGRSTRVEAWAPIIL